jgi:hypothetical protein
MVQKPKLQPLLFDTYFALIKNSVGSSLFRNAFYRIDGKKLDILRNGDLSCAIFVSSILRLLDLIPETHTTVKGTEVAMRRAGWHIIKKPVPGSILVWAPKTFKNGETHRHIGFYLGNRKAISNSSKKRCPFVHDWTFGLVRGKPKRKIETIYWYPKLDVKR